MTLRRVRLHVTPRRLGLAAGIVAATTAVAIAIFHLPWILNVSESLPVGIYRTGPVDRPLVRGDRVVVCPPVEVAGLMRRRHYLASGACPGGVVSILKIVGGVAGDTVELRRNGVYIDGTRLPHSSVFTVDSQGRALPSQPFGRRRIPPGELWLWTPNPDSFDSRYFGIVPVSDVRSRAHLIVPFAPWAFSDDLPPEPL